MIHCSSLASGVLGLKYFSVESSSRFSFSKKTSEEEQQA